MTAILIIGTNKPIMETIERLINKELKWLATIAFTVDDAIQLCESQVFGITLICGGLPEADEIRLKEELSLLQPQLPIVTHYGGGSGLLYAEIYQGLRSSI